jgi:hypothetical protein
MVEASWQQIGNACFIQVVARVEQDSGNRLRTSEQIVVRMLL